MLGPIILPIIIFSALLWIGVLVCACCPEDRLLREVELASL